MSSKKRRDLIKKYEIKTWRDLTPMNSSAGLMLHNQTGSWRFIRPTYEDKTPACQNGCPAGNDIEGWMRLIQSREYERAYWHLKQEQPFPAILGRVCFRFCEGPLQPGPVGQPRGHQCSGTVCGRPGAPGCAASPSPGLPRRQPGRGRFRTGRHVGRVFRAAPGVPGDRLRRNERTRRGPALRHTVLPFA